MSEEIFEWNPSVICPRCDGRILVSSHTFPGSRIRPFFTYKCEDCDDSGSWEALARAHNHGYR